MRLIDAHNHLHDRRLDAIRETAIAEMVQLGIRSAVVNGTQEDDWDAVAKLAAEVAWARPSFGLHPWYVANRTPDWLKEFTRRLDSTPRAAVGEIGLDRWIEGHHLAVQTEVFEAQLAIASERNLPATIHCLRAWGALGDSLHARRLPQCGFLLHSYGGPAEMVQGFVKLGAYFSFSPYFLRDGRERQRAVFREIPQDRILVETDAPDMAPPDDRNQHPLRDAASGVMLNHPANLELSYAGLADLRDVPFTSLVEIIDENFRRLFGN